MQFPSTTNYAVEFPAFGEIAGVSTSECNELNFVNKLKQFYRS